MIKQNFFKNFSVLIMILILGIALRFSFLTFNPPSLNWDEVSHGYNAYSILKTGKDQWGQKLPILNFRAYGDYPTTLNLYLTIPFIVLFGLTEFAIRFPHALLGTLTIISVYFLTLGITKRRDISLLSAFLVAIGPWYVFTSRFVLQSNISVFLLITAIALFVNRVSNKYFFPLSIILLFLTLFSYHTTRIFSPLFILGITIIYRKEISNKIVYLIVAGFVALSFFILVNPSATARGNVLFIIDQGAINKIIDLRNSSKLPNIITKVLYNRPAYFVYQFSKNYISYFSPTFLFFNGGTQYQFNIPNSGLIYWINLPFFYIGIVVLLFKSLRDKNYLLVLLWLVLSPIPASLTNESYAVIRDTTVLPIPEILISIGICWVLEKTNKKYFAYFAFLYFAILYILFENYLLNYFTSYRTNYSSAWQYGYKEVVNYVGNNYSKYDKIIITKKYGEPHEYFLFFLSYDPKKYQQDQNTIRFFQSNWYWVDKFDKFYFVNDWQIPKSKAVFVLESKKEVIDCTISGVRCLLVTSPGNYPVGWKKVQTINFLNNAPDFEMYEN